MKVYLSSVVIFTSACSYSFSSSVSDGEMLRVWEDLSGKYRMNYRDDNSHEYNEVSSL